MMEHMNLEELYRLHASKKSRMIWGIVLAVVGIVLDYVGLALDFAGMDSGDISLLVAAIVVILISLALLGVGIPFFVTGLVGMIKANRAISRAKEEAARQAQAQQYQQYQPYAPQYGQPQAPNGEQNPNVEHIDWK